MFTTNQVSKEILKIPTSTLRRYINDFSKHLSEDANLSGRGKRFNAEDTSVLKRARNLLQEGRNVEEVNALLLLPNDIDSPIALVPEISKDIATIELEIVALNIVTKNLINTVSELTEKMSELKNTNKELVETNKRLNENERRLNELEFKRKSLFKRIFNL